MRPVFPAPCMGPELCPGDMCPVMYTLCFPVCVHSLGTSKCARCCVPSLVLVHGIVCLALSSLDSHLLGAPVWGCPPSAERDSGPILVLAPRGSLQPLHLYELMSLLAHLCRKTPEFSLFEGSTPTSKTPHPCGESQQGEAPQAGIVSWAWGGCTQSRDPGEAAGPAGCCHPSLNKEPCSPNSTLSPKQHDSQLTSHKSPLKLPLHLLSLPCGAQTELPGLPCGWIAALLPASSLVHLPTQTWAGMGPHFPRVTFVLPKARMQGVHPV